jgi:predicted double-glycine peptidase
MLDVKPYRQTPGLCGPSSLKKILNFFGIEKTENELAEMTEYIPNEGTKSEGIIKVAKLLGLNAFQKDLSELEDLKEYVIDKKIPVIVDWFSEDDGHYSVIVDIDNKNVYMQDPQLGDLRTMDIETFRRVWFDFPGDYLKSKDDIILRRMIVIHK